jgi:hypothetical protein
MEDPFPGKALVSNVNDKKLWLSLDLRSVLLIWWINKLFDDTQINTFYILIYVNNFIVFRQILFYLPGSDAQFQPGWQE